MTSFQDFVERWATGRRLIALLVVLVVVMTTVQVLDVPWSLVRLKHITGGVNILDMHFHYASREAYDVLAALGPEGRSFYLWRVLGAVDVVLPALFATILSTGMAVAFRGVVGRHSGLRATQWLPVIAMLLDYTENVLIARLLLSFPAERAAVASAAGWTTTAKHLAYISSVAICLVGGAARIFRSWESR